jgi:hypothetical protein
MNGYCGDCDKQIEFHDRTVEVTPPNKYGEIEIYLICPWCEEKELIIKTCVE